MLSNNILSSNTYNPQNHYISVRPQHPHSHGKNHVHYKPSEPNHQLTLNPTTHLRNTIKRRGANIIPNRHHASHLPNNSTLEEKMHHFFDDIPHTEPNNEYMATPL